MATPKSKRKRTTTDAADSTAGIATEPELDPGTPEETGRPPAIEVAEGRAKDRKPLRVIGADSTND